jgi:hypothetical protein
MYQTFTQEKNRQLSTVALGIILKPAFFFFYQGRVTIRKVEDPFSSRKSR